NGTILKSVDAGVNWAPLVSGTTEELLDVSFADALNGTAVGKRATVLTTTDGGATWLSRATPLAGDALGVSAPTAGTGFVVGPGPIIIKTGDGGATWSQQTPFDQKLQGLVFPTAAIGYAVADNGSGLKTVDGGATWSALSIPTLENLHAVDFADANTGFVVGRGGIVLKTADGGGTWASLPSGTVDELFAVSFPVDASTGFAAGKNGTIIKTTDGGASWASLASGTLVDLFGLDFSDNSVGVAVGKDGVIVRTTNGGSSWSTRSSGVLSDLNAVQYTSDPNLAFAVGQSGVALKSTNGGQDWSAPLVTNTTKELESVNFPVDALTGYAAGASGTVIMTSDGGTTWSISGTPTTTRLNALAFTGLTIGVAVGDGPTILHTEDPDYEWVDLTPGVENIWALDFPVDNLTGYAVGKKGSVLRTTDGGNSWIPRPRPTTLNLVDVDFADNDIGYAVAKDGVILKTSDGAGSWGSQPSGTTKDLKAVQFPLDATTGFVVGQDGTILKTTNGGSTYAAQTSGTTQDLYGLSFPIDGTTGYAVGKDGTILKTTNGGSTWVAQTSGTLEDLFGVVFPVDASTGFAVGKNGTILFTSDGGATWGGQTSGTTEDLYAVDFVDNLLGHAVGKNGTILHTENGGTGWSANASGVTHTIRDVQFPLSAVDGWAAGDGPVILKGNDAPLATFSVTGTVFEDVVGDVLNDGVVGDVNNPGVASVDVHLYLDADADGIAEATDPFQSTQTTDVNGDYAFAALPAGSYFVVVDSLDIQPAAGIDTGNGWLVTDVWAEQTYGPGTSECADGAGGTIDDSSAGPCYGGRRAGVSDDLATWHSGAEHLAKIQLVAADATSVDFGFSFNVATTTAGGDNRDDDPAATQRTVQGSMRQFITNANATLGANEMRFTPANATNDAGGGGNWWQIDVSTVLPTISGADTDVVGIAYDMNDGASPIDPNSNGPELQIDGNSMIGGEDGFYIIAGADGSRIESVAVTRFPNVGLIINADNVSILDNHVGVSPDGVTASGNNDEGIIVSLAANGTVIDGNLIGDHGNAGISLNDTSTNTQVTGNTIGTDAGETVNLGNLQGVWADTSGTAVIGGTTAADGNVITNSAFDGLELRNTGPGISVLQNSIHTNGKLGINLVDVGDPATGITPNDPGDFDTGANGLLNYAIVTSATVLAGTITVDFDLDVQDGTHRVEFFLNPGGADPSGSGEGESFVSSIDVSVAGGVPTPSSHTFSGALGDIVTATATEGSTAPFGPTS
ncbi:MAG: hypothetical protein KJN81_07930, partial [Acidimicrobiia bacterium]|nr:hypothetical protein [Acidimicrobiia bacterium]NNL28341.1 hypothetical protein [Acidimicrobiia bacterium]